MARSAPVIVWFRNDLRIVDHPALVAASRMEAPVIAVYVLDDAAAGAWMRGGASRWWLHHSLAAHAGRLEGLGCKLVLRRGDTIEVLTDIVKESGAATVLCSRSFEPWAVELEGRVREALLEHNVEMKRFAGTLLHDPDDVLTKTGGPYKVYTPFWRALSDRAIRTPVAKPAKLDGFDGALASDALDDWGLLPTAPDWAGGLRENWTPGQEGAKRRLAEFLEDSVATYAQMRDVPSEVGTSRLSPHLHFGELTPAQIWHAVRHGIDRGDFKGDGPMVFLKEIAWREFSYHLLHHFPKLPEDAFRPEFDAFPWAEEAANLEAWQKGQTGYPIVDAGMRELWETGWMHNRVRMIVASFLVKHLMVPWQKGEAWFWDCLVDADLASNAASWQWVAGSGADASPYFRIFNPILQGEKFDSKGGYVRRWVPELEEVPDKYLHAPWTAPKDVLEASGVKLGETYPAPIVDHKAARQRALDAYAEMREQR